MRLGLPEVPYDATAERPAWADLPESVRVAIEERLGGPVATARIARSGFTRGFAAVVVSRSGTRAFVKATSIDYLVDAYRREAAITAALPVGVPAARPRWTIAIGDWYALGLDAIDGHLPSLPWRPEELRATLDAWATAAAALASPAAALASPAGLASPAASPAGLASPAAAPAFGERGLPEFADIARSEFRLWREIATHRAPLPVMPRYAVPHLDELADLEGRLVALAAGDRGLMHCDLRLDNVLITGTGTAWLCDWNHVCHGPAWFDTASLLVTAYASGFDADELFATHPTVTGATSDSNVAASRASAVASDPAVPSDPSVPSDPAVRRTDAALADALDAALAGLAGLWLGRAGRPSDASPSISAHQSWSGRVALAWLAERRGWAGADDHVAR